MLGDMLSGLRNTRGRPALRVRVVAVLLILGLAATTAPLFAPAVRWLLDAVAYVLF